MAGIIAQDKKTVCKLHAKVIKLDKSQINLPALSEVFAMQKYASILGGNEARKQAGRYSYWAAEPTEVFEFCAGQDEPFEKLQKALGRYVLEKECSLPAGMFSGGWVGFLGYELGRFIEKLPATMTDDLQMPLIRLCFYDRFIAYDHIEGKFRLIALQLSDDQEQPKEKLAQLEGLLFESAKLPVGIPNPSDVDNIDFSRVKCNMSRDYYLQTVEKIKRYIYDGEVYQINFSQRFENEFNGRPIELFHWQNFYNPSGYSAYLDCGDWHIVSASPEMFLTVSNGLVSTKPIKGTRPRSGKIDKRAAEINEKNFNELVRSEKEQAELNMIVDLERNDLVKICEYGTRKVVQPRTIEAYPTVFHAVATVEGRLRKNVTFSDIIKATFPGGSITGAPKVRAMEIIDETEPTARGVYTGSIGFVGIDGNVCLNIAIRTIIIKGQKAYFQSGGGIVADSDAEAEWNETITKARALLAGIKIACSG